MHRTPRWLSALALAALVATAGCEKQPELTPAERIAKDRAECQALATQQTTFDPLTAPEPPPKTISRTERRGGKVVGSGDIVKGAAGGAALGAVGGAIMGDAGKGAGAGAAIGGVMGGVKRHKQTNEMVTRTSPNPDYAAYMEQKDAFRAAFEQCLAQRSMAAAGAEQ
jgi:hypothetical protein